MRQLIEKIGCLSDSLERHTVESSGEQRHLKAQMAAIRIQERINSARALLAIKTNKVARYECSFPTGECTLANDALGRLWGMDTHSMLGWGWLAGVHASDQERVREHWLRSVEHFMAYRVRYRLASGEEVEATGDVVRCDDGKPVLFSGIVTPVAALTT